MSTSSSRNGFFELYRDFLQQSSGFWAQAVTAPNPPDPSEIWQQFYDMWTAFWNESLTPAPDMFQAAHKLWMEQLDTTSKGFEDIMGTAAYGAAVSKFFQEQLAWQEKLVKAAHPQIEGALRAINLPSRSQIDRLFERVVGMEARLDDLETESRQIRQALWTNTDAVGELKQHMTALATQLADLHQHLETMRARTESQAQPDAVPTPQTPHARSQRKSPPRA
jgi:phage shock protein A